MLKGTCVSSVNRIIVVYQCFDLFLLRLKPVEVLPRYRERFTDQSLSDEQILSIRTPNLLCFHTFAHKEVGRVEGRPDCRWRVRNVRSGPLKGIFLWMPLRSINGVIVSCTEVRKQQSSWQLSCCTTSLRLLQSPSTVDTNSVFPSVFVERTL